MKTRTNKPIASKQKRGSLYVFFAWLLVQSTLFAGTYSGGTGEPNDPYQIATAEDLVELGDEPNDYNDCFVLTADIDLDGYVFDQAVIAPACFNRFRPRSFMLRYDGERFSGYLNGQGHVIRNLRIQGEDMLGLFGRLGEDAEISNLGMEAVDVNGSGNYMGGIVGDNQGTIRSSYTQGRVRGYSRVGGLVGSNDEGTLSSCYSSATVSGEDWVGGLIGVCDRAEVTSCYSTGTVNGEDLIGGLIGSSYDSNITSCYSVGTVCGDDEIGGLLGESYESKVLSCFWDIETSGQSVSAGGIGLTTLEMMEPLIYIVSGWAGDPNWVLESQQDYPRLAWEEMDGYPLSHWDQNWIEGEGTQGNPYQIDSVEQFSVISRLGLFYDQHLILSSDLDCSGIPWFDAVISSFSGFFDGNDHVIRNLQIEGEEYLGLVGQLESGATITNLGLMDVDVNGAYDSEYVGSLVGYNQGGTILSSYSTGEVSGCYIVGGLIGGGSRGLLRDCHSDCQVTGYDEVGGLVGRNGSYTRGQESAMTIISCYSSGTVNGEDDVGGLIGYNYLGSITTSYSTGDVHGEDSIGGLVGTSSGGHITSCYSQCRVNGEDCVGGLIGINVSTSVVSSYSTSVVSGVENSVGGLVGANSGAGVLSCVWDVEFSGLHSSDGGIGLTTAEMMNYEMLGLNGWDQDPNWVLDEGQDYPRLAWQETSGQAIATLVIDWIDGDGSVDNPYQIGSVDQLIKFSKASIFRDDCIVLENDLDLSGWCGAQALIPYFEGRFDGQGHVIKHLTVQGDRHLGLFGYLSASATILDLGLEAVDINGMGYYVGAVAGFSESSHLMRVYSTGAVVGLDRVGGLVGHLKGGEMIDCSNTGMVTGFDFVGGLVGYVNNGNMSDCYNMGTVCGRDYVGGLLGYSSGGGSVVASYVLGEVYGDENTGGLVGYSSEGYLISSFNEAVVQGNDVVGGVIGYMGGSILACYNQGSVNGVEHVGGLVGYLHGEVASCLGRGLVIGENSVGGLIGTNRGLISMSFWDMENSGQPESSGGRGLTTFEMRNLDTFLDAGWDLVGETAHGTCDFWNVADGSYPSLAVFSGDLSRDLNGAGIIDDPYRLADANELGTLWLRPWAHYRLEADIDLRGISWNLAVVPVFRGVFDGNDHVISNLNINGIDHLGLFGECTSVATISHLGLEAVDVNGNGNDIGGLVGLNRGIILSSSSSGQIRGDEAYVGGLVGYNGGSITLSYSTGSVSGRQFVGGLTGANLGSLISNYNAGAIDGSRGIGGVSGWNNGIIISTYNTGAISGGGYVGGLVGTNVDGVINTSYSNGDVIGTVHCFGGLVGWNGGTVTSSFWDIETSGQIESEGGIGLPTAQMQDINTFLDTGWDFVGETANGTEDIWWMPENDYPRLWWEAVTE